MLNNNPHSTAERWEAVVGRSRAADGTFVYAVKTTGVYCRPTCPSRRPKVEHVLFFSTWKEAERAGFRPCLKCRPSSEEETSRPEEVVRKACRLIEDAESPPRLDQLADQAGMSASGFHRVFKRVTGVTPKAYALSCRRRRLQNGLANAGTVTEAVYEAGFGSSGRLYDGRQSELGMTPGQYKRGGPTQRIRYAVTQSCMGWTLVAATDAGVCRIEFGESEEQLRAHLAEVFPRAELVGDAPEFAEWVERVVAYLDNPGGEFGLPLDMQGTAFQQKVWKALQEVPAGQRATYTEIAERLGCPSSVRAVAGACASNRLGVVVPCHRIVRRDGGLAGYYWGLHRKRALLAREEEKDKTP